MNYEAGGMKERQGRQNEILNSGVGPLRYDKIPAIRINIE